MKQENPVWKQVTAGRRVLLAALLLSTAVLAWVIGCGKSGSDDDDDTLPPVDGDNGDFCEMYPTHPNCLNDDDDDDGAVANFCQGDGSCASPCVIPFGQAVAGGAAQAGRFATDASLTGAACTALAWPDGIVDEDGDETLLDGDEESVEEEEEEKEETTAERRRAAKDEADGDEEAESEDTEEEESTDEDGDLDGDDDPVEEDGDVTNPTGMNATGAEFVMQLAVTETRPIRIEARLTDVPLALYVIPDCASAASSCLAQGTFDATGAAVLDEWEPAVGTYLIVIDTHRPATLTNKAVVVSLTYLDEVVADGDDPTDGDEDGDTDGDLDGDQEEWEQPETCTVPTGAMTLGWSEELVFDAEDVNPTLYDVNDLSWITQEQNNVQYWNLFVTGWIPGNFGTGDDGVPLLIQRWDAETGFTGVLDVQMQGLVYTGVSKSGPNPIYLDLANKKILNLNPDLDFSSISDVGANLTCLTMEKRIGLSGWYICDSDNMKLHRVARLEASSYQIDPASVVDLTQITGLSLTGTETLEGAASIGGIWNMLWVLVNSGDSSKIYQIDTANRQVVRTITPSPAVLMNGIAYNEVEERLWATVPSDSAEQEERVIRLDAFPCEEDQQ